jgi:hypothetical protein
LRSHRAAATRALLRAREAGVSFNYLGYELASSSAFASTRVIGGSVFELAGALINFYLVMVSTLNACIETTIKQKPDHTATPRRRVCGVGKSEFTFSTRIIDLLRVQSAPDTLRGYQFDHAPKRHANKELTSTQSHPLYRVFFRRSTGINNVSRSGGFPVDCRRICCVY